MRRSASNSHVNINPGNVKRVLPNLAQNVSATASSLTARKNPSLLHRSESVNKSPSSSTSKLPVPRPPGSAPVDPGLAWLEADSSTAVGSSVAAASLKAKRDALLMVHPSDPTRPSFGSSSSGSDGSDTLVQEESPSSNGGRHPSSRSPSSTSFSSSSSASSTPKTSTNVPQSSTGINDNRGTGTPARTLKKSASPTNRRASYLTRTGLRTSSRPASASPAIPVPIQESDEDEDDYPSSAPFQPAPQSRTRPASAAGPQSNAPDHQHLHTLTADNDHQDLVHHPRPTPRPKSATRLLIEDEISQVKKRVSQVSTRPATPRAQLAAFRRTLPYSSGPSASSRSLGQVSSTHLHQPQSPSLSPSSSAHNTNSSTPSTMYARSVFVGGRWKSDSVAGLNATQLTELGQAWAARSAAIAEEARAATTRVRTRPTRADALDNPTPAGSTMASRLADRTLPSHAFEELLGQFLTSSSKELQMLFAKVDVMSHGFISYSSLLEYIFNRLTTIVDIGRARMVHELTATTPTPEVSHRDMVDRVMYIPSEHVLVSSGRDACIRIWDVSSDAGALTRKTVIYPAAHYAATADRRSQRGLMRAGAAKGYTPLDNNLGQAPPLGASVPRSSARHEATDTSSGATAFSVLQAHRFGNGSSASPLPDSATQIADSEDGRSAADPHSRVRWWEQRKLSRSNRTAWEAAFGALKAERAVFGLPVSDTITEAMETSGYGKSKKKVPINDDWEAPHTSGLKGTLKSHVSQLATRTHPPPSSGRKTQRGKVTESGDKDSLVVSVRPTSATSVRLESMLASRLKRSRNELRARAPLTTPETARKSLGRWKLASRVSGMAVSTLKAASAARSDRVIASILEQDPNTTAPTSEWIPAGLAASLEREAASSDPEKDRRKVLISSYRVPAGAGGARNLKQIAPNVGGPNGERSQAKKPDEAHLAFLNQSRVAPFPTDIAWSERQQLLVVCSMDRSVNVYDARRAYHEVGHFVTRNSPMSVAMVVISGAVDVEYIVLGGLDGTVTWHEAHGPDYTIRAVEQVHSDAITQMEQLAGIGLVSSSLDGTLVTWDMMTWSMAHQLHAHTQGVHCFAYSQSSGLLISAGHDRAFCVYNPHSGKLLMKVVAHSAPLVGITFHDATNQMITTAADKVVKVWDMRSFICTQTVKDKVMHVPHNEITALTIIPDQSLVVSAGSQLRQWRIEKTYADETIPSPGYVHSAAIVLTDYSPEYDQIVVVGADGLIKVWDMGDGAADLGSTALTADEGAPTRPDVFEFHSDQLGALVAATLDSTKKMLLTHSVDGSLKVWNFNSGAAVDTIGASRKELSDVTWMPSSSSQYPVIGVGSGGRVIQWHGVRSSRDAVPMMMRGQTGDVVAVEACDSFVVTASSDGVVAVWRGDNGALKHAINMNDHGDESVEVLKWVPETGVVLLGDRDGVVNTLKVYSGKLTGPSICHTDEAVSALAVRTPACDRVIIGDIKGGARLWKTSRLGDSRASGMELSSWDAHVAITVSIAYVASRDLFVSASHDGEALLWSASDGSFFAHLGDSLEKPVPLPVMDRRRSTWKGVILANPNPASGSMMHLTAVTEDNASDGDNISSGVRNLASLKPNLTQRRRTREETLWAGTPRLHYQL